MQSFPDSESILRHNGSVDANTGALDAAQAGLEPVALDAPAPAANAAPDMAPGPALAPVSTSTPSPGSAPTPATAPTTPPALVAAEHAATGLEFNEQVAAKPEECETSIEPMPDGILAKGSEKLVKHPLQNVWTLWYLETDRTKSWEDMQKEISSFDNVEDFWRLYTHIKPPSEIEMGSDYSLFKKDIRPMCEDAANNNGGRCFITLNNIPKDDLDQLWLDVLLCLIGEVVDHLEHICGAVVNIRGRSNKISIWTSNGNDQKAILEIGHKLRNALRLDPQNVLQYQLHMDTMAGQGSNVSSAYTL